MSKSKSKTNTRTRGRWFGLVLYPDNEDMMSMFDYMIHSGYSMIWIQHEGKSNLITTSGIVGIQHKPHIHIMIHYKNARSIDGVLKSFCGIVKHVELISDPYEMARYFLHMDYKSHLEGKEKYNITDVRYTDKSLFNSLYCLKSSDTNEDYPRILAEVGSDCLCFPELVKKLYEAGRGDVVLYAMNHSGGIRLLFPHFPYTLNDVKMLQHGE